MPRRSLFRLAVIPPASALIIAIACATPADTDAPHSVDPKDTLFELFLAEEHAPEQFDDDVFDETDRTDFTTMTDDFRGSFGAPQSIIRWYPGQYLVYYEDGIVDVFARFTRDGRLAGYRADHFTTKEDARSLLEALLHTPAVRIVVA